MSRKRSSTSSETDCTDYVSLRVKTDTHQLVLAIRHILRTLAMNKPKRTPRWMTDNPTVDEAVKFLIWSYAGRPESEDDIGLTVNLDVYGSIYREANGEA